MKNWDAAQYARFEAERNRPIHDLLAQLPPEGIQRAVDIGCGPGNSTELLLHRWPQAEVRGMDNSPEMISAARARLPGVQFELGDAGAWSSAGFAPDLVFSNAVLQWVPDHRRVLPALLGELATGGWLAVQMPDNLQEPVARLMREVAAQGPWAQRLAQAASAREAPLRADEYFRVLREAGATVDVWRTTYHHPLAGGPRAIVEWFKGSALRPFLQPLDEPERADYLARYEQALAGVCTQLSDGTVLLPFPRLFFVARRN